MPYCDYFPVDQGVIDCVADDSLADAKDLVRHPTDAKDRVLHHTDAIGSCAAGWDGW